VHESLKQHGFVEVSFKTSDNIVLRGLFLSRPNATCNVILSAGWRPGKKEGLATFYDILPDYCNILFFDTRGHGESEGPLFWKLWRYGVDEYKDTVAAVSWTNKNNALPIIIYGACSGAFNAAHAAIHLEKNNNQLPSNVKGLVFDSGWGSVMDASNTAVFANAEEGIAAILKHFYKTKELVQQSLLFRLSTNCARSICTTAHSLLIKPIIRQYEPITNLFNKIGHLNLPTFFIHSYDDRHVDIHNVIKLSELTHHKKCWWIRQSYHTQHHLIHREAYKEKLTAFINEVIQ
jgi:pimeloyl-ACP methyl ester carboxylesterase